MKAWNEHLSLRYFDRLLKGWVWIPDLEQFDTVVTKMNTDIGNEL